jgi:hypothetical protein
MLCNGNPDYLAWEEAWKAFGMANNHRIFIFRCAGIYGNTRSALHTLYSKGIPSERRPSSSPPPVTNRIHEGDLTRAIVASMVASLEMENNRSTDGPGDRDVEIYNIADNEPASRQEVFEYARSLMEARNITLPASEECAIARTKSIRAARRGRDTKRVCNQKMRHQLISELNFPSYREGLLDVLNQKGAPWNL